MGADERLAFTTGFHHITREQLDEIIFEGDSNDWPSDSARRAGSGASPPSPESL